LRHGLRRRICGGLSVAALLLLAACAGTPPLPGRQAVPQQADQGSFGQLGKSDFDRMADIEMRENTQSLRTLMIKLYKRNPRELRKSSSGSAEQMAAQLFNAQQDWKLPQLGGLQGIAAIQQAFQPGWQGDRVLSLIVGLQTMLIQAHGGKTEFYLADDLDPQRIYNAARNIEIAVWKLSNARDEQGRLYLLTNEQNDGAHNLSFEREFGEMIGRLDLLALALSEKTQRFITQVVQTMASALFLPP